MSAPNDPPDEEEIFQHAAMLPVGQRAAYLESACAGRPELLEAVARLLASIEDEEFMGKPLEATASPEMEAELARLKPEEPGESIGPYKLLQQIGEGGFGVVWMAEQEKPVRRRVALKIIKLGMDTKEVIARFEQERQALALMEHPNIAKVLDAGSTQWGRPFFVMELVKGVKITEYCDQASLPTEDRLHLFVAVCHAVQHAHQKGIIHRDLKPSNILVTLHDGVPVPKVIDFGVAKATQQQRLTDLTLFTQFEQMIGTPLYMSPEQAELSGLDIDTRSDIYSLGVLLYELLTGRTPFDPETLRRAGLDEIRRVIREEEPLKPSIRVSTLAVDLRTELAKHRQVNGAKLIGQIRGDLDWIVMKALEKDRTRRYETANGFAQDILRHLGSEPVQARPPTALYRFRRMARRNKLAFAAAAGITAALLAGITVSAWQAFRANAALLRLRASAPAFAGLAQSLAAKDQIKEAIEQLDIAIELRPDVADYPLQKAALLQSELRFSEARAAYEEALRLNPREKRAEVNGALCGKLAAEWNRLKELPIPPGTALKDRITTQEGALQIDLTDSKITDLSSLEGLPVEILLLRGCKNLKDLRGINKLPIWALALLETPIADLSPLVGMRLKKLNIDETEVSDLSALRGMDLTDLSVGFTRVYDLSPLRGMPLTKLRINHTSVSDLSSLVGMPLLELDCSALRVTDFTPLFDVPLKRLGLEFSEVKDISFLKGKPLDRIFLNGSMNARGFKALAAIPTLRWVGLPSLPVWPDDEIAAVEVLRDHSGITNIAIEPKYLIAVRNWIDTPNVKHPMMNLKKYFWPRFDEMVRTRVPERWAREGNFAEAEKLLREHAKDTGTPVDWLTLVPVVLAQGVDIRYQALCKEVMARFKETQPEVAGIVCLLGPNSGVAKEEIESMIKSATGEFPSNQLAGLNAYRAGRHAEAVSLLEKRGDIISAEQNAQASVLLSLAYQASGMTEAAKATLSQARATIQPNWPGRTNAGDWGDWLLASLYLQEAERLIEGPVRSQKGK